VIAHTGAAGVMIGRAAQGQPWLCGQIATHLDTGVITAPPCTAHQFAILRRHVTQLHQFYGDFMGVRIARKHVGWYWRTRPDACEQRSQFNRLAHPAEQLHFIDQLSDFEFNKELAA
jgi:tRNA-dihydrouridine synthase B